MTAPYADQYNRIKRIKHDVKAYIQSLTPFPVTLDAVPRVGDEMKRNTDGDITPYVILHWYGAYGGYEFAFAGPREDQFIVQFDLINIDPDPDSADDGRDMLFFNLIGWKPDGASPIGPNQGFGTVSVYTTSGQYAATECVSGFKFTLQGITD